MAIYAFLNPKSGSMPENASSLLEKALTGHGLSFERLEAGAGSLTQALSGHAFKTEDLLIVWGGDGTIACAIEETAAQAPLILPLPGGTMDLLHKRIHGAAMGWKDCLDRALGAGYPAWLTGGRADGRPFYVALMAGALTRLSEAREALRSADILGAARKATMNDAFVLEPELLLNAGETEEPATAIGAFVNPDGERANLEIGAIDPDNIAELAAIGLAAALDSWQSVAGIHVHRVKEARLRSRDGTGIDATLDGEAVRLPAGVTLSLVPRCARVLSAASS